MSILRNGQFTVTQAPIEPELLADMDGGVPSKHTLKFRLLDDDNEIYFVGFMKPTKSKVLFYPLDTLGASYGCTTIQILELGSWVTV